MYLLDNSVAIELMNAGKRSESALSFIGDKEAAVTPFTVHEIIVGLENEDEKYINFLNEVAVLDYDKQCAEISGKIRKEMKKQGNIIGILDTLIASIAIRNNITLVTFDKGFSRVKGLRVEVLP